MVTRTIAMIPAMIGSENWCQAMSKSKSDFEIACAWAGAHDSVPLA
jgi:hypothetical protein